MSDQTLSLPTAGDPATIEVELTPPTPETANQEPAQPSGTPLDDVNTLRWHIDRTVTLAGILSEYITNNFKSGVDFGSARGKQNDKPTLLKPGGEKLITVLGLRVKFVPDRASLAMAGNPAGLFAYKCLLINWRGEIVGEGRGACSIGERSNMTINNAIKMAEKRAQGDAICRVACVSEHFTSDDDITAEAERQEQRQETNARRPTPNNQPAQSAHDQQKQDKAFVWNWYKNNRKDHNQATDNESVIGDINDLLRSYRLGATVNTATPAEWARAANDLRKQTLSKPVGAAVTGEEIFN